MKSKFIRIFLAFCLTLSLTAPAAASSVTLDQGGYTDTAIIYTFLLDQGALIYNKKLNLDYDLADVIYSGSDLYIPIGYYDPEADDTDDKIAAEKQIKNDNVQVSYKVMQGRDHVDSITIVSSKKEKLKELPAGMYVKISYTRNFLPLYKTRVSVRMVLSVNGVSYQDTAVTIEADLQNREEYINRNSVFGALTPSQFQVSNRYFGESSFDFGEGVKFTGRVGAGKRYYLNLSREDNPRLTEMYSDAYLEFYNFMGTNDTFASTGRLIIPVDTAKFKANKTKAQVYGYEIVGDQLRALTLDEISYQPATGNLTLLTRSLGSYVFSNRALIKDVYGNAGADLLRSGYAKTVEPEEESSSEKP